ncbi:MAG: stage II sporulation protein M [Phototrophicaceae bacterium]
MATPPVKPSIVGTAGHTAYSYRDLLRNAFTITRREVNDSFRDWRILTPILFLTLLFPSLATVFAQQFTDFILRYGGEFEPIADRMVPFLLMIVGFFPISISLVIALETFVGEKERRSLEPLLSTPLTNTELYIGKTVAAIIPPLVASYGGMGVYLLSLLFGELQWRPQPMLIVQIFLLTSVQAVVMVAGAVVVSSQTTSTRAANLLASFIIIPMTFLIQGESFVMFIAPDADSPRGLVSLWLIIIAMLVIVTLLLRVGNSLFDREELLGSSLEELNLRTTFLSMWRAIRSIDEKGTPARHLWQWYTHGVSMALRHIRVALGITTVWFVLAFVGGLIFGYQTSYRLPIPNDLQLLENSDTLQLFLDTSVQSRASVAIFSQNFRALALIALLATFSFGTFALIGAPIVFVVLGYLLAQLQLSGIPSVLFWGAVLPHGIIEIPTIILASGVAFYLGAIITRPQQQDGGGKVWMVAFGDLMKIMLGLVMPLLMLAALLEAFVTPLVILQVLGAM